MKWNPGLMELLMRHLTLEWGGVLEGSAQGSLQSRVERQCEDPRLSSYVRVGVLPNVATEEAFLRNGAVDALLQRIFAERPSAEAKERGGGGSTAASAATTSTKEDRHVRSVRLLSGPSGKAGGPRAAEAQLAAIQQAAEKMSGSKDYGSLSKMNGAWARLIAAGEDEAARQAGRPLIEGGDDDPAGQAAPLYDPYRADFQHAPLRWELFALLEAHEREQAASTTQGGIQGSAAQKQLDAARAATRFADVLKRADAQSIGGLAHSWFWLQQSSRDSIREPRLSFHNRAESARDFGDKNAQLSKDETNYYADHFEGAMGDLFAELVDLATQEAAERAKKTAEQQQAAEEEGVDLLLQAEDEEKPKKEDTEIALTRSLFLPVLLPIDRGEQAAAPVPLWALLGIDFSVVAHVVEREAPSPWKGGEAETSSGSSSPADSPKPRVVNPARQATHTSEDFEHVQAGSERTATFCSNETRLKKPRLELDVDLQVARRLHHSGRERSANLAAPHGALFAAEQHGISETMRAHFERYLRRRAREWCFTKNGGVASENPQWGKTVDERKAIGEAPSWELKEQMGGGTWCELQVETSPVRLPTVFASTFVPILTETAAEMCFEKTNRPFQSRPLVLSAKTKPYSEPALNCRQLPTIADGKS